MIKENLSQLPSVDRLLALPELASAIDRHGRQPVTDCARAELAAARELIRAGHPAPSADALASADPTTFSMPRARGLALTTACGLVADGTVVLDPGSDRGEVERALSRVA